MSVVIVLTSIYLQFLQRYICSSEELNINVATNDNDQYIKQRGKRKVIYVIKTETISIIIFYANFNLRVMEVGFLILTEGKKYKI